MSAMRPIPALLMAASAWLAAGSADVAVWPVDALIKLFKHDAPDTNRSSADCWTINHGRTLISAADNTIVVGSNE